MSIGLIRALRILHRTYSHYPLSARLHVLARFLSCPFTRTIDLVPQGARLLEIGAGHGIYARLAVEERAASAVGIDPDLRKVLLPLRHPKIRLVGGFDEAIRGEFDTVAVIDVLYRLGEEQRDALFRRIHDRLRPGGLLIVKSVDPTHRLKSLWDRVQERAADLLGLTVGEVSSIDTPQEIARRLTGAGFTGFKAIPVGSGYPHAHIVYTARKPLA